MTKLVLIGDIHGYFEALSKLVEAVPDGVPIIQVGDFGFWPQYRKLWESRFTPARTIHFVDGNHDYIPGLGVHDHAPEFLWDGRVCHVPRGTVLQVGDAKVLFCGGSKSVDRAFRRRDSIWHGWFDDEQVTDADVERAITNVERMNGIDLMITHTPPDRIIRKHFPPSGLERFNINPDTWVDESALRIQRLHDELGKPPLVCGHMHRSIVDDEEHVRILDISEVYVWMTPTSGTISTVSP